MTDAICKNCKWWGRHYDEYSGYAQCRRYPPIGNKGHSRGGVVSDYVKTGHIDFCGEFAAKEQDQ